MPNSAIAIRAEVHSDDFRATARFDAEPFFQQASDQDLIDLAEADWGGDEAADRVAREMEDHPGYEAVGRVLDYASDTRNCGFECHVHAQDAEAWLFANRPALYRDLIGDEPPLRRDAQTPDWDRDRARGGPLLSPSRPGSRPHGRDAQAMTRLLLDRSCVIFETVPVFPHRGSPC